MLEHVMELILEVLIPLCELMGIFIVLRVLLSLLIHVEMKHK